MKRSLALVGFLLVLFAIGIESSDGAGGPARLYRNDAMRVRAFQPPPGWELAPQASYPRLLASYASGEGGRITLSAQKVAPAATAERLAENGRAGLAKEGFSAFVLKPDGERERLSAHLAAGKRTLEQLYIVDEGIGYVVTLVTPDDVARRMTTDFESALRTLQVGSGAARSAKPR
jgi:hypothetical protein